MASRWIQQRAAVRLEYDPPLPVQLIAFPVVSIRARCNTCLRIMITLRLHSSDNTGNARPLRISGVVFDMDGLLLDTERLYRRLFQQLVREQGHALSDEGYGRMVGHRIDISKQVLAEEIGSREPVDAIFDELEARYHNAIAHHEVPARPGARELITFLREHGVPLALATSTYRHLTDAKLRNTGLADAFAVTVCGDEVSRGKPHPDPYLNAVAGLGIEPQQALALEDSPTGLTAAHSAGLHTVLIPDLVAASPASIAMADAVADSLHTVLSWFETAC